jgi:predicted transposase YdaD
MSTGWDELLKMLVRANPQDIVSLVSHDTHFLNDITQELITRSIRADFLCKAVRNGEEVAINIEFQREQDETMGKRMWEYNCVTSYLTRLPVYSCVIYLWEDTNIVEPPYVVKLVDGKVIHIFYYDNIFLWKVSPETLQQKGLEGLLPLLPLTKGAKKTRDRIIGEMIEGLRAANKEDLLALGYAIAGRVYATEDDKQWLKRRFAVFQSKLEESWSYQEMVQKGLDQGLEIGIKRGIERGIEQGELKALRPVFVRIVERRFAELTALAQQRAEQITSPELLSDLIDKLLTVQTLEQARQMLVGIGQTPDADS